jgi:topoisomerase IA-like protein
MSEIVKQLTEGLNELVQERQKLIDERDNLIKELEQLKVGITPVEVFRQGIYFMQQCIHEIGNVNHTVYVDSDTYDNDLNITICGDMETTINISALVGEYVGDEITDNEILGILKSMCDE